MARYFTAVCAALIAAFTLFGTSVEANARCSRCGPVAPVYNYRTVNKMVNKIQYRNVQRTHYVHKTRHIYNITRVRPIVRVHTVTRVHHHTVPVIRNVSVSRVQHLPAHYVHTNSVQNVYHGCGCH
ncbi:MULTISPECIES: hypothetical protein [Methylobacterium]|jgi:hypothetical protein|uniref:Uncharacterized protein n=1 Tax=Methylobacterium isbiliense TaxID=315478 RepID=A0ABQ4SJ68_9HYPH|nr:MULTISPECIES: hypothetical protein [Methylobacterium]MBY0297287.1 hypothetical protein [Methylobacterium sp.]MDN3624638.1 hypothetical protein [Methylobacterium isbiliense]GJE01803.1 hypothetical protein GMJLKIPL_3739 [Methylobacterium isbiliense]